MVKHFERKKFITSLFLLVWIYIINVVAPLITHATAWPMFFVLISFFFLEDTDEISNIFVGGVTGILLMAGLIQLQDPLVSALGMDLANIIGLTIVLVLVFVGGNFFPMFLNNVTFLYITMCSMDVSVINELYVGWILMTVIGGGVAIFGVLVVLNFLEKKFDKVAEKAELVK